ncbi:hypothetical protein BJ875DRAFT_450549 [Amylocarpus encephaloides]|uniref:Uncharacterized protein n=1 Tax=Amylocarpus encephaloides TaxID=45428 RepID=A0A9P7YSQ4_9HELO|nr:hypothetical protein BJ875DRAFT_450549 [Amylocarpus encephaloides]
MENQEAFLESLQQVRKYLQPYIKQRQDASQIRRILASHLNANLYSGESEPAPQPLSLVQSTYDSGTSSHGFRGVQKEYLRCARSNMKARREYSQIRRAHQSSQDPTALHSAPEAPSNESITSFLELVKQQQKNDVLRVSQDYINTLAKKPASDSQHLDPQVVLKNSERLPQCPPEVLQLAAPKDRTEIVDLQGLLEKLEKSVLRAKMLLKREQKLLSKFRSEHGNPTPNYTCRIQALGTTRNELISWIETELSEAAETSPESEGNDITSAHERGQDHVNSHLMMISRQYSQYAKTRHSLVAAASGHLPLPHSALENAQQLPEDVIQSRVINFGSQITHPYLNELLYITNQQKALVQQKSQLTISFARQLKEASQVLDRLEDESHLLPAYPIPANALSRRVIEGTGNFGELSSYEKPDSSRQVRGWTYASQASATAIKVAILEKLEEGSMAIDATRNSYNDIRLLLGERFDDQQDMEKHIDLREHSEQRMKDVWAKIDGSLGAIKHEGIDIN